MTQNSKIKVCDAIMGSGKSSAAITLMGNDPNGRYLFVTPYLDEVNRIMAACSSKNFKQPADSSRKSKLKDLHRLLEAKENIASTHALFSYYTEETGELIRAGGYTLIMDEVFCVLEEIENMKAGDIKALLSSGLAKIGEDGVHVVWMNNEYDGSLYKDIMMKAKAGNLLISDNSLLFWNFPPTIFECFKEIYILTYLFSAQLQCAYYKLHGLEYEYIGTAIENGRFCFSKNAYLPDYARALKSKIHILDDEKLNHIGKTDVALSKNWFYRRASQPQVRQLKNNLYNVFRNRYRCGADNILWTTFKCAKGKLSGDGYASRFTPCNLRAQNKYSNCHYLAYCANRFLKPAISHYFQRAGVAIHEDEWALSEMIQWIWRSAIRNGEDIWIYIPSRRMRALLETWLDELSQGGSSAA